MAYMKGIHMKHNNTITFSIQLHKHYSNIACYFEFYLREIFYFQHAMA